MLWRNALKALEQGLDRSHELHHVDTSGGSSPPPPEDTPGCLEGWAGAECDECAAGFKGEDCDVKEL